MTRDFKPELPYEHIRTMSIVSELLQGKRLEIDEQFLVMGEDMSIGFVFPRSDGTEGISPLSLMYLAVLNKILTKHGIGLTIPSKKELDSNN